MFVHLYVYNMPKFKRLIIKHISTYLPLKLKASNIYFSFLSFFLFGFGITPVLFYAYSWLWTKDLHGHYLGNNLWSLELNWDQPYAMQVLFTSILLNNYVLTYMHICLAR